MSICSKYERNLIKLLIIYYEQKVKEEEEKVNFNNPFRE